MPDSISLGQPELVRRVGERVQRTRVRQYHAAHLQLLKVLGIFGEIAAAYDDAQREALRAKTELQVLLPAPGPGTIRFRLFALACLAALLNKFPV